MALRTFHANPALGGFGGSGGGATSSLMRPSASPSLVRNEIEQADAVAQIIKELVDNAVDACHHDGDDDEKPVKRRVRVTISEFHGGGGGNAGRPAATKDDAMADILSVNVSDNGCGMESISACVHAFQTSKGHGAAPNANATAGTAQTAGRYGIGLTLCLLHAQRLVPNSRALISSCTASQQKVQRMMCVVDTDADAVDCVPQNSADKVSPRDSGTSVTLLVPGGAAAVAAWPRLAEYFGRFVLNPDLPCGFEVLAPALAHIPLHIKAPSDRAHHATQERAKKKSKIYETALRKSMHAAAQDYLGQSVMLKNVSHASVPIRQNVADAGDHHPTMHVTLLVHDSENADDNQLDEETWRSPANNCSLEPSDFDEQSKAAMVLVRLVNGLPLLDSAEALACGVVQSLTAKKRMWNSFGLNVTARPMLGNASKLPIFDVQDSDQVAPFLRGSNHALLAKDDSSNDADSYADENESARGKRSRTFKGRRRKVLPAEVRLDRLLLIVHIRADPCELPLPTLSKGRLPIDNEAIDSALEVALTKCLRQLQSSNPNLLLSSQELRTAERDCIHVPAIAASLAAIVQNCTHNELKDLQGMVESWSCAVSQSTGNQQSGGDRFSAPIEDRLRLTIAESAKKKLKKAKTVPPDESEKAKTAEEDDIYKELGVESMLQSYGNLLAVETASQVTQSGPIVKSMPENEDGFKDWEW